jgi:predicted CopG family antitoxin
MGTKTIRVREEVYEELEAHKRPDESFSDLLERLTDRTAGFEQGFGALAEVDFEGGLEELNQRLNEEFRRAE